MHLYTRNVNTAFRELVKVFDSNGMENGRGNNLDPGVVIVRRPSRNGNVLMIDEPVTVTYTHPRERVLFNAARDANPFFGLYEQLWMLAGRNDVAPLTYYASKMKDFSDDGMTLNGAYGYRWRHATTTTMDEVEVEKGEWEYVPVPDSTDQLDIIVNHLKADPNSRRAVLQMWNVEDDLLKIGDSKDVCCNLSVMFSLREGKRETTGINLTYRTWQPTTYLDMTVTNRSNDMVWGMLGQDYITFTILQEYMAARLGAEVGRYHHFTNNLHVYDEPDKKGIPKWKPDEWLGSEKDSMFYPTTIPFKTVPLVKDPAVFERELPLFVRQFDGSTEASVPGRDSVSNYAEPFLRYVAQPMLMAFQAYKRKDRDVEAMSVALEWARTIQADDWRIVAQNWLQRRAKHGS